MKHQGYTMIKTLSPESIKKLHQLALEKANLYDVKVCIVVWDIDESGGSAYDLISCHAKGVCNDPDMTQVNKILDMHEGSEILDMVSPTE